MTKILFLTQSNQKVILDRLYDAVLANSDCDLRRLSDEEQADLKSYFQREVVMNTYERIILFLRFKKELRQVSFLRTIPNLVILEHDAFQNYFDCKYKGKFSEHYRKLPWARIIVSGANVAEHLKSEGFDAVFVAKGYDETLCRNFGDVRDIELGFVGGLKNRLYSGRKQFLEELATAVPLFIGSAEPGEPYVRLLNRIKIFISADIGFGEYMIKNFEAMACGCLLVAYDQGEDENRALGLRDMENVVLYKNTKELLERLDLLRKSPELIAKIAAGGQALVEENFRFGRLGKQIVEASQPELRSPMDYPRTWREQMLKMFNLGFKT